MASIRKRGNGYLICANDRNLHSRPSTTLDIYTHAFDKNKKATSQVMQSSLKI